ncbi:hypothetical protein IWZ00DRAFT_7149 [Phyllosticta capitalensis]
MHKSSCLDQRHRNTQELEHLLVIAMNPLKSAYVAATGQHAHRREKHKLSSEYILYTSALLFLKFLVLLFWGYSRKKPFAFPISFGLMLDDHPKSATLLWTFCGTVLAYSTLFLLDKLLNLMVRQKIQSSTYLSTIEGWSKLSYHKIFPDVKSPYLAMFSMATWIAATALTSTFTALITPTQFQQEMIFWGHEIDLMSDEMASWLSENGNPDDLACDWFYYRNNETETAVYLYSCPWERDLVSFISSGMINAVSLTGNAMAGSSFTRVADSVFKSATGGVLPIGYVGIQAFMADLDIPRTYTADSFVHYNYSIIQQGITADISCTEAEDSPISRSDLEPLGDGTSSLYDWAQYTFTYDDKSACPETGTGLNSSETFVTPANSAVGVYMCQSDIEGNDWRLFLRPYDNYESIFETNLTCTVKPYVTRNNVTYRSDGFMVEQQLVEKIENSASYVPLAVIGSIYQAFITSVSSTVSLLNLYNFALGVHKL